MNACNCNTSQLALFRPIFSIDQLPALLKDLTIDEIWKLIKHTTANRVDFQVTYFNVQIVLQLSVMQERLSVVLGNPINSESSTFNNYRAILIHQSIEDKTTASVCHSTNEYLTIATHNLQYVELSGTTLNQNLGI